MKVAIITGGKRVGKLIAKNLSNDYKIIMTYHKSEELIAFTESINGLAIKADVRKKTDVDKLFNKAKTFGEISLLINMASYFNKKALNEVTEDDFDSSLSDLKGTFLCSMKFININNEGLIINFSDAYSENPYPGYLTYFAAKGGVEKFTLALSNELKLNNSKVRVNCIAPGNIMPPEHIKIKTTGKPEQVVDKIVDLINNKQSGKIFKIGISK